MSKSRAASANNQRSNVKNPNNASYVADRSNRSAQGHVNVPPPPNAVVIQPVSEVPENK